MDGTKMSLFCTANSASTSEWNEVWAFMSYICHVVWRPSHNKKRIGLAKATFGALSDVITAGVEVGVGNGTFDKYNALALVPALQRASERGSSVRVPKGVKRAVANAVTHGEGLSKSNQVITSAKMLSGTTPLKRVRVNGKQPYVRSRPVNGWCVDNGIQYLLGSRLLWKKVPEISGFLMDGSSYACQEFMHVAITNPDTDVCVWLPPAAI